MLHIHCLLGFCQYFLPWPTLMPRNTMINVLWVPSVLLSLFSTPVATGRSCNRLLNLIHSGKFYELMKLKCFANCKDRGKLQNTMMTALTKLRYLIGIGFKMQERARPLWIFQHWPCEFFQSYLLNNSDNSVCIKIVFPPSSSLWLGCFLHLEYFLPHFYSVGILDMFHISTLFPLLP